MTSEASFMTFGYRAFFDTFSWENHINMISDASFLTFGYRAFFELTAQAVINDGISACNVRSLDVLLTMIMTLEGHCKNLASLLPSAQSEDIFLASNLFLGQ